MELFSYHIFLFPFQWQFASKQMRDKTLEERTCLKELTGMFDHTKWSRKPYKTDKVLNYNEYNYFYNMVREVMFDDGKDLDKTIIANLFYDIEPDACTYNFKVCVDDAKKLYKDYSLHIESIILHLYATGVGVLSFHLNNRLKEQSLPNDILNINQAGRRLYPPYFGIDFGIVGTQAQYDCTDFSGGLDRVMTKELAKEFSLIDYEYEDFGTYRNAGHFSSNPFQMPRHIAFLFQGIPITVDKEDFNKPLKKVFISPLLDDRMYVVCWYGNHDLCTKLQGKKRDNPDGTPELNYEADDWWYKYMFNDQTWPTCQNEKMKRDLIKEHTYSRWTGYGTFYGVNRYSFVCLTDTLANLKVPPANAAFIVNHMQTMYYKMAELCLVQRACLLRFSDEVTSISAMKEDKKIALAERVGNLYKQYLRFVNRIYFREITAQEQGIELYDMLQKHMKIETNVKDLDHEIQELHTYVAMIQGQKQNRNIELLTIIGALFFLPAFINGFFGMSIIPSVAGLKLTATDLILLLTPVILTSISIILLLRLQQKRGWAIKWTPVIITAIAITIALVFTIGKLVMNLF